MTSRQSRKNELLALLAGPVAHPRRYRKQLRVGVALVILAVGVYFVAGLLPLVVLLVIGALSARYGLKRKSHSPRGLPR